MDYLRRSCRIYAWIITIQFTLFGLAVGAARDQWGRQFLVFRAYSLLQETCVLEVHVITDHFDGTLVDMMTPRLKVADGGIRRSIIIKRHEPTVLCAHTGQRSDLKKSRHSNNAILVESEHDISVLVVTKPQPIQIEMQTLYPLDVLGTHYHFVAFRGSLFIVVATEDNTRINISASYHGFSSTTAIDGHSERAEFSEPLHAHEKLEKYEGYIVKQKSLLSGLLVMSSYPVMVMSEAFDPYNAWDTSKTEDGHSFPADQLLPVDTWGREFLVPKPENPILKDLYIKVIVQDIGHEVSFRCVMGDKEFHDSVGGMRENKVIKLEFTTQGIPYYCEAQEPVSVVLLVKSQFYKDVTYSISKIPPIEQHHNLFIVSVAGENLQNILHIVAKVEYISKVRVKNPNGQMYQGCSSLHTKPEFDFYHINCSIPGHSTVIVTADPEMPEARFAVFLERCNAGHKLGAFAEIGMRVVNLDKTKCKNTEDLMEPGDTIDNDCDGLVDEEGFYGSDNDGDGRIGEDMAQMSNPGGYSRDYVRRCSGDCETGKQELWTLCTNPPPSYGGVGCKESKTISTTRCKDSETLCSPNCKTGTWGRNCNSSCPFKCEESSCDQVTGVCDLGCQSGYYGSRCQIACHIGYGGKDCSLRCLDVCGSQECDAVTLQCKQATSMVFVGMCFACMVIFGVCPLIALLLFYYVAYYPDVYYYEPPESMTTSGGNSVRALVDPYEEKLRKDEGEDETPYVPTISKDTLVAGAQSIGTEPVRLKTLSSEPVRLQLSTEEVAKNHAKLQRVAKSLIKAMRTSVGMGNNDNIE